MKARRITAPVEGDLKQKMVFVTGPRQCGKTTLANDVLSRWGGVYRAAESICPRPPFRFPNSFLLLG